MGIDVEIGAAVGRSDYGVYRRKLSTPHILAGIILIGAVALAIVFAFEFSYGYILGLNIFTLKEIAVFGNNHIGTSDILDAAKLQSCMGNHSICSILPHVVERRIKSRFRYLANVEIKRSIARNSVKGIYGLLTIAVKEREPVALVAPERDAKSFIVADASGIALEKLEGNSGLCSPYADMPVILGVGQEILEKGILDEKNLQTSPLRLALNVVINARAFTPELCGKISYINAGEPDDIILYLRGREASEINVRLASDRIREGLEDIVPVISRLTKEGKETKYVDARFSGAVYCMGLEDASRKGGGIVAQE